MPMHRRSGFTWVELVVIVCVLGLLMAMLLPAVQAGVVTKACCRMPKDTNRKHEFWCCAFRRSTAERCAEFSRGR